MLKLLKCKERILDMKKLIVIFRWITLPIIILLVLLVITFILNFIGKLFNPNVGYGIIMFISAAFACYFSIKLGLDYSPIRNKYVLFAICSFLLLITGGAFVNSNMIHQAYFDNWGNFGNIMGIGAAFFSVDTNDN